MKLTLLVIAGFLLFGVIAFTGLIGDLKEGVERQYAQAAEEPMVDMAQLFASLIESTMEEEGQIDPAILRDTFAMAHQRSFSALIYDLQKSQLFTHVFVTDRSGRVLFDSENGKREGLDYANYREIARTLRGEYGARSSRTDPEDSMSSVFYVAAPVRFQDEIVGVVSVSRPEDATMGSFVDETRRQLQSKAVRAGVLVTLTAVLWTYLLLRPIARINRQAREVEQGSRQPLTATGVAELRTLGRNLEKMRQALEGKQYVESYVETLTHELKSPLAAIQGAAELLQEELPEEKRQRFAQNVQRETERASELVQRMLQLSALESQAALREPVEVNLAERVRVETSRLTAAAEARNIQWDLDLPETGARLPGDPFVLEIAIRNLLSNAVDFSPEGGAVSVSLAQRDGGWELEVRDRGPGIPGYAHDRLFERFYSLKHEVTGRKSSGLGLCFVREAADLHKGTIHLENHPQGGAVARLWIPE